MAGSGIRVFAAGEILTAAQVNGYLMDQTVTRFANAATRDASFGGVGQPTLTEGRICYLDDTNLIQFYDGSTWVDSGQFTIGDGTITNAKLAANSVTSDKIAAGTVIAADIAAGTITATELATGAVTSAKILDGTIVNGDINAAAAIDKTKISGTAVTVADTGTVTSTMIADGTIVNGDINAAAAIAATKISGTSVVKSDFGAKGALVVGTGVGTTASVAVGTNDYVLTADSAAASGVKWALAPAAGGFVTSVNGLTGAVTGVVRTADTGTVTSTMILDGTILNGDINASAAIAYSKLNVANSIVNADISSSAAIALSKLATSTAGNIIVYNASGVPTAVAETGDITISDTGVTAIASGVIVNGDISSTAAIEISKIADVTIDSKASTYTLVLTDKNKFIEFTNSTSASVVVPTNSVAFPVGSQIHVVQNGTGKVHVVANTPGTTSIRSTPGQYLRAQYSSATLIKRATEEWYLIGDLSAT
jgi:hypothetical protein